MNNNDALVSSRYGLQSGLDSTAIGNLAANRPAAPTANVIGQAADAIGNYFNPEAPNTQRFDLGQIDNLKIVDELKDGDATAYGAFNSETGEILITRSLMEQAQNGHANGNTSDWEDEAAEDELFAALSAEDDA